MGVEPMSALYQAPSTTCLVSVYTYKQLQRKSKLIRQFCDTDLTIQQQNLAKSDLSKVNTSFRATDR